jgi:hypothetical protein
MNKEDLPMGQTNIQMNKKTFQKMLFIMNALQDGWTVKKSSDTYIFTKKHENRREIFREDYLENFIHSNLQDTNYNF